MINLKEAERINSILSKAVAKALNEEIAINDENVKETLLVLGLQLPMVMIGAILKTMPLMGDEYKTPESAFSILKEIVTSEGHALNNDD